jgi:Tc5 transposase DNA-binding domain
MPPEPSRKPRPKPKPYERKPQQKKPKDAPATSAGPSKNQRRANLTLHDWMTVFAFVDKHPALSQGEIVTYFGTRMEGALEFTQCTLSRKLRDRASLEARIDSNPSALSSKRPRIVVRPDVERALYLWVKHMEEKRETVSGPMLRAKRRRFEELFNVPEEERLPGDGWVASFCKA